MAKIEKFSFEYNEVQQILSIRDTTTPYQRLQWLEANLNTFKEQILKNQSVETAKLPKK